MNAFQVATVAARVQQCEIAADHVQGGPIGPDCGHFLPEECPNELTEAVLKFWQSTPR